MDTVLLTILVSLGALVKILLLFKLVRSRCTFKIRNPFYREQTIATIDLDLTALTEPHSQQPQTPEPSEAESRHQKEPRHPDPFPISS